MKILDPVTLTEQSAPSTPASGRLAVYAGADNRLHAIGDDGADVPIGQVSGSVGGRAGTLTAETAGTTKTPRWYNRLGRTITVTAVYASVDTAPAGSSATVVLRKNGSATGAITVTISAAANTGSQTGQSLSVADGDYLQVWPTAVGSTTAGTDLNVQIIAT